YEVACWANKNAVKYLKFHRTRTQLLPPPYKTDCAYYRESRDACIDECTRAAHFEQYHYYTHFGVRMRNQVLNPLLSNLSESIFNHCQEICARFDCSIEKIQVEAVN